MGRIYGFGETNEDFNEKLEGAAFDEADVDVAVRLAFDFAATGKKRDRALNEAYEVFCEQVEHKYPRTASILLSIVLSCPPKAAAEMMTRWIESRIVLVERYEEGLYGFAPTKELAMQAYLRAKMNVVKFDMAKWPD